MLKRGQIFIGFFLIFSTNCWAYLPDSALAHEDIISILKSIPFSTPTHSLIKKLGIQYDKNILAPKRAYSPYKTKYQEALYLGVCHANFRYASIYGQNEDAL